MILLGSAGACDRDGRPGWAGSVDTLRDGAVVVRNPATGSWGDARWRLKRIGRIGALDGEEPYIFGRVADVALGPGGLVYALDSQAAEVRVFDLAGRHVRTIGGRGRGPGEFADPYAIAFDPDGRLWVAEEDGLRYSAFDPAGDVVAIHRRPLRWTLSPGFLRFSDDGALYERGFLAPGRGMVRLAVADSVVPIDTVALPAHEPLLFTRRLGPEQLGRRVPFAPRLVDALGPDGGLWVGVGDAYRIVRIGPNGDTLRVIERDAAPVPLSETERAEAAAAAARAEQDGFDVDRSLIPSLHPHFTGLVVADDGHLWVRRPAEPQRGDRPGPAEDTADRAFAYDVFDPDGRYLGSVRAPVDPLPSPHITGRHIVGVARDSLEVAYVEVYRIVRPGG